MSHCLFDALPFLVLTTLVHQVLSSSDVSLFSLDESLADSLSDKTLFETLLVTAFTLSLSLSGSSFSTESLSELASSSDSASLSNEKQVCHVPANRPPLVRVLSLGTYCKPLLHSQMPSPSDPSITFMITSSSPL